MNENGLDMRLPNWTSGVLVVSTDVVETLTRRHGIRLTPEAGKSIRKLELQFLKGLGEHFDGIEVSVVSSKELEEIYHMPLHKEKLPVVSIDDLWLSNNVFYFHINRELDPSVNKTGPAPRKGHLSLEGQARQLRRLLPGDEVALLDRGCIGGGTIARSVEILRNAHINVRKVYIAIRTESSLQKLREKLGTSIEVVPLSEKLVCGEWVESRDLVGISGRPVKSSGWIPYFMDTTFISAPLAGVGEFKNSCVSFLKDVEKIAGVVLERL